MSWFVTQGDAVEVLRRLPSESIDLIVTDTAYESLEKHRAVGTTTRLTKSWFQIFPNSRYVELFEQMYRVLRKNSHLYWFCDSETMFVSKPIGESVGFKFWKPLIWDKKTMGMGYHYRGQYEMILFFEKGKRKLNDLGVSDVLPSKRIRGAYPTQKPEDIAEILISQSTQPGEVVLDPFMGSGSTGTAAIRIGRQFIGCDLSHEAVTLAKHNLERGTTTP